MNGSSLVQPQPPTLPKNPNVGGGVSSGGARSSPPEAVLNSIRIGMVADRLVACDQLRDNKSFFQLCLSLARGIDYGVANNDIPEQASRLPLVLKQVCRRKNETIMQAAVMVLMISVKNACKMGWFSPKDTEDLLALANEVGNDFGSLGGVHNEAASFMPIVSSIMSRYYPQLKLGQIIASLEIQPGYGTYAVDFHISKDISYSPEEKIRLFVALKDNIDTSSCIISPQGVNLLLNGKGVDRRTNCSVDPGPQLPTIVNPLLKYGTNLLQAVGPFNGHYIILISFMSAKPTSLLPAPQDYVQHDSLVLSSGSDSEIIEGPSRISLNCPISYRRIKTPVKGHLCKHYKCFDFGNYVEINAKRPSWRCPHCNQSVCFTDIRVDQKMLKVLQEVEENVSEVMISADGSWTPLSCNNQKDASQDKNLASQQGGNEVQDSSADEHLPDASCNVYDLTAEDDEMDTEGGYEPVDTKPVLHHNVQSQPNPTNSAPPPTLSCSNVFNQSCSSQAANSLLSGALLYDYGTANHNMRSEAQNVGICRAPTPTGNFGISPVMTDSVSPALTQQRDSFQGTNYMANSTTPVQFPVSNSSQIQELMHRQSVPSTDFSRSHLLPRSVSRTPSAIQALAVQLPLGNSQHTRPAMNMPAASGSPVPSQTPQSNVNIAGAVGGVMERQRHQPVNVSNMAAASMQNRSASPVMGLSTPSHLNRMPQTLSQPPHLMRSTPIPRNHIQQNVPTGGVVNSPSTVQRVQLMSQPTPPMRQPQTMPHQTQSIRIPSINIGAMPQAVSRTENLIDLQSEQNWRPSGRMRGSLSGHAYSEALSQLMGQSSQLNVGPSPRPSGPSVSSIHALVANRNALASQLQSRSANDATINPGTLGSQPGGPQ